MRKQIYGGQMTRKQKSLPPQKLYVILRNIYPKGIADEKYTELTGLEPPEGEPVNAAREKAQ